tara:strand:- start:144 stop:647 length:504 start_codon:yes stop_codon:yes gene_type:complete
MSDNMNTARALYGAGWLELPEFARVAAADFVPVLLDMNATSVLNGNAMDIAHEVADDAVPFYNSELLFLLADYDAADAILEAADSMGGLSAAGSARDHVTRIVAVGVYGVVSNTLGVLVAAIECGHICWTALGLDDNAAEVAAGLMPEWAGTVGELVAAAASLEVAR